MCGFGGRGRYHGFLRYSPYISINRFRGSTGNSALTLMINRGAYIRKKICVSEEGGLNSGGGVNSVGLYSGFYIVAFSLTIT